MQALVIHAAGDLRVEEVDTPELLPDQLQVRVRAGGICGSDLHYFQHGGFGTVRIRQPMVLGHEVAGSIEQVGTAVQGFAVGERIAISPSRPCASCRYCQQGLHNHCLDMRYYGARCACPTCKAPFASASSATPARRTS
jgi:L-idonate 5-dehydrogenase